MPLPEGYTQEEFDGLTPDEQESLGVELDDKGPSVTVDESEAGAALTAKETAAAAAKVAADAETKKAADAKTAEDATAAEAARVAEAAKATAATKAKEAPAEGGVQDTADPKPAVAVIKADKIVSDEEHVAAKAALAKQFEDGEVTTAQFIDLSEDLTRAKLQSDMATRSAASSEEAQWAARQDAFFSTPGNEVIRDDPRVWAAMQAQLESMYADVKFKDYTDMQFLNEAGREVRKLFGIEPAAKAAAVPAKKPAGTEIEIPTTLAGVPAAESNTDGGNEFSALDKLNGMEYEFAYAKLSAEQRAKYLAM
jgi:hypothetical protein